MESFTAIEKINSTQNLSVRDFQEGNINIDDVMEEVNYLKNQITVIRQEMAVFLTGIATIGPASRAQQIFEENTNRVIELQKTLDDYVERFKRLTPLLNVVNQDLNLQIPPKREPQLKPPVPVSTPAASSTNTSNTPYSGNSKNTTTIQQPKKQQRKRPYTKKKDQNNQIQTPNYNQQTPAPIAMHNQPIVPNPNAGNAYQTSANIIGFQPFQGNNNGNNDSGSENQPIML